MSCYRCARGITGECDCAVDSPEKEQVPFSEVSNPEEVKRGPGRPRKSEIGESAGRKRAASEYEINPNQSCEWRGLANCGGGLNPIIGCITGLQQHRHHGPVKNTAHNERSNIHLVCSSCHNLWHARNDEIYDEDLFSTLLHEPRIATSVEMLTRG